MAETRSAIHDLRRDMPVAHEAVLEREESPLALVLGGGGARAAYQVGILRWLARRYPRLHAPILVGVSAGAINAAMLASQEGDFGARVETLADIWSRLETPDVYRVDARSLLRHVLVAGIRLLTGARNPAPTTEEIVDTRPLWGLLGRLFGADGEGADGEVIPGIAANLRRGTLKGIAITTTSYATGRSITWVQGRDIRPWNRPDRRSIHTTLGLRHVIASAALPLIFPAVEIDGEWFADGGVGLTAPLSPAANMGAARVLAITTRCAGGPAEDETEERTPGPCPGPAEVFGSLLDSAFPDQYDADALSMERRNRIAAALPPGHPNTFRRIRPMVLRPSQDLGALADEFEPRLPKGILRMIRGRGGRGTRSNEMFSMLMFQPDYLGRLIELGEQDAEARRADLEGLLGAAPRGEDSGVSAPRGPDRAYFQPNPTSTPSW